jgi:hypothetical protein
LMFTPRDKGARARLYLAADLRPSSHRSLVGPARFRAGGRSTLPLARPT